MRLRLFNTLLVACFLLIAPCMARAAPSLAIMNFTSQNLDDPEWQWLGKGLADMLVTDLSRSGKFTILDREKMQQFLDEQKLDATAMIDQETALKIGRTAKVQKALFGTYKVTGAQIVITAQMVDVSSQKLVRIEQVKGAVADILDLEKTLALKVVENLHVPLGADEIAGIKFKPTDSLDAAARFYRGLDAFDQGKYFDALREFRLSEKSDPEYDRPIVFQGHVYENQGEYAHAILTFKKFEHQAVKSEFAPRGLFFAAKLSFKHFKNAKEALRLADIVISRFDAGSLPNYTEIAPALRKHQAIVLSTKHDIDLDRFMLLFKSYVYIATGEFKAALQVLHAAEKHVPPKEKPLHRTYYEWRKAELVRDAYGQAGVVLLPEIPKVIELDPANPVYEEDYTTDKRFADTFHLGSKHFNWGGDPLKTVSTDPESGDRYIHNAYFAKKDQWFSVEDIYAFAVPEGYVAASVALQMQGAQRVPNALSITVHPIAGYPTKLAVSGRRTGKVSTQGALTLMPGTRFFRLKILIEGNFTKKMDQLSYISGWQMRVRLKRTSATGGLKISSNTPLAVFVDAPVGQVRHAKAINWSLPHRDCPCTLYNLPAGKHRIVVFAAGSHRSVYKDGRRQERTVTIENGTLSDVTIDFTPRVNNDVAGGLPKWHSHVRIAKGIKRVGAGGSVFNIELLQDRQKRYWIVWHQGFDLWYVMSENGTAWTQPEALPAPINTQAKETRPSLIEGEDDRFYLAFMSERGSGSGLYVTSSADMKRWTKPRRAATPKHLFSSPSLLQLESGRYRIYYSNKGYEISYVESSDFKSWTEPVSLKLPEQDFGAVIQAKTGMFWMVYAGYKKHEHPIFIAKSQDGESWEQHVLVKHSITNHNLASFYPTIVENDDSELVLAWHRTTRVAFSKSQDGVNWSPSRARITSNSHTSFPEAPVAMIMRHDGKYMLAYSNHENELWVSLSEDPFY